jgi:hypothetical protein
MRHAPDGAEPPPARRGAIIPFDAMVETFNEPELGPVRADIVARMEPALAARLIPADVESPSLALGQRIRRAPRLPVAFGPTAVGPSVGPKKKSPSPTRSPATVTLSNLTTFGERATGLEPATSSLGRGPDARPTAPNASRKLRARLACRLARMRRSLSA